MAGERALWTEVTAEGYQAVQPGQGRGGRLADVYLEWGSDMLLRY